jgi:quercetin dioxygenase-like cupin family protein
MFVRRIEDVKQDKVDVEGARGVKIRWVISEADGAPNFAMRAFEIEPGGHTPYHSHYWEHEVYVIEGHGVLVGEEGEMPFERGMSVFVAGGEMHNFKNTGSARLRFLCLVPHKRD